MKSSNRKSLPIALALCAIVQTVVAQTTPEGSQGDGAALAIELTLKGPMRMSAQPEWVYFASVGDDGSLLQPKVLRSTLAKHGRVYLLDVPPGTYVAVGAHFLPPEGAAPAAHRHTYTTYFSRETVEKSKVTVGEHEVVFLGTCVVNMSVRFDDADDVQVHYKNVIAGGARTDRMGMLRSGDWHYLGALKERKDDDPARAAFGGKAQKDLAGTVWAERLK